MSALTLPKASSTVIILCALVQGFAFHAAARHHHRSLWLCLPAFFIAGFLTDLVSGVFHFSFDYVWPPQFPVMGPIAVEFREHHENPTLDPSALLTNFTKGSYAAIPLFFITWIVARTTPDTPGAFLACAILMASGIWMLAFHQIHSYAHMGSSLPPEEFNTAVAEISTLSPARQRKEMARLFDRVGIPQWVRLLQRSRILLRPEVHWRHHIRFEQDFSSVNGWSDPLMNLIYRPVARRKKLLLHAEATTQNASPRNMIAD